MRREYNIQEARKRIKHVFQYLRDLNHIKKPPVVHHDRYEWKFWLDTLPLFPSIVRGKDFTNLQLLGVQSDYNYHSADGDFIIKVSRPNESECPEPSVILKNWLKPGYAGVGVDPSSFMRKELEVKGGSKGKI